MREPGSNTPALPDTPGLVSALRVLRERWWIVAVCAVTALAVAALYAKHKPKLYTTTAALQFTTNSLPSQLTGVQESQSLDPEGTKATYVQLVTTRPVAELVIKALRLKYSPTELLDEVSASNPQNDYIVNIAATDRNPQLAAAIANGFAQQYALYSQQQNVGQLIKGEQLIDQKYSQLPAGDSVDRGNLRGLYQKLLLLQAVQTGNAQVINTASVPTSPSSPKTKATAAIALIVGILLGIGLSFLLNLLDRRIKSWEDFEQLYGMPALASIPALPRRPRDTADQQIALEPFRILHNSLSVLHSSGVVKTVLVTSAVPGEGKTTVALGLARAAAMSGREVILVEADLRRPTLEQQLTINQDAARIHPGPLRFERSSGDLSSVLLHGADPMQSLCTPISELPQLKMLFGGAGEVDIPNLLNTGYLRGVFEQLASHADMIIIDSAPLLPVVDTRALLEAIVPDACLVVARVATTKREEVRRARAPVHPGNVGAQHRHAFRLGQTRFETGADRLPRADSAGRRAALFTAAPGTLRRAVSGRQAANRGDIAAPASPPTAIRSRKSPTGPTMAMALRPRPTRRRNNISTLLVTLH